MNNERFCINWIELQCYEFGLLERDDEQINSKYLEIQQSKWEPYLLQNSQRPAVPQNTGLVPLQHLRLSPEQ